MSKESHLERTAQEARGSLHHVVLAQVDQVNPNIRIFRLEIPDGGKIRFLPGQWLDVHIPSVPQAGGFTITSPPARAAPHKAPDSTTTTTLVPGYLELAVQRSPANPPAAWLWDQPLTPQTPRPQLAVRIGGAFIFPPPGVPAFAPLLRKIVFVAGGVGVNPLACMLAHLAEQPARGADFELRVLYSLRDPGRGKRVAREMLFLERMVGLLQGGKLRGGLDLFLTPGGSGKDGHDGGGGEGEEDVVACHGLDLPFQRRRITVQDVKAAVGADRRFSVVYVCGVPTMTDTFVKELTSGELGMEPHRVLHEKWW